MWSRVNKLQGVVQGVKVEQLAPDDEALWEDYIAGHSDGSIFHTLRWRDVIQQSFGHQPCYLICRSGNRVYGILPLFLIKSRLFGTALTSAPYVSYCGICADNENTKRMIIEEAKQLTHRLAVDYLEIRDIKSCGNELLRKEDYLSPYLKLYADPDKLWRGFKPNIRNEIRKAERYGLVVKIGSEWMELFYRVFVRNMRDLGTPVYSLTYFVNIFKKFPHNAELLTIWRNHREVVGGGIILFYKDALYLFYASCIRKYFPLYPNNLLYWKILEYGCKQGYKSADFGRSAKWQGTLAFKRRWGMVPRQLYYEYYLRNRRFIPAMDRSGLSLKILTKIWSNLPVPITQALGPFFIRQIPG